MPTVRILGPSVDGVIEPVAPDTQTQPVTPGRQQIDFDDPKTAPGGNVNLVILPLVNPGDKPVAIVYAFHVPQKLVPAVADRTTDWFFKSGHPSQSAHAGTADPAGKLKIQVAGVKPSLDPYHVQTVLEYEN